MDNKNPLLRQRFLIAGIFAGLIVFVIITSNPVFASGPDSTQTQRHVQVTFIYPMGTNGGEALHFSNNFSLNILAGISGGTRGIEAGGLVNDDRGPVNGFQCAGIGNIVTGPFSGIQSGGLFNISSGNFRGLQLAGLVNTDHNNSMGILGAGLVNLTQKDGKGMAASGITNVNLGSFKGTQLAGITNVTLYEQRGVQAAGILNVTTNKFSGLQVGGIASITTKEFRGLQVGGLVNYAKTLNGMQLGFINYSDSIGKGIPLGFLSIVRHGYRRVEVGFNETLFGNITFKTGTSRLYNIFSIGYRLKNNQPVWGVTYGLGTLVPVNERLAFNIDLTSTHLNENESWTDRLNMLNRLRLDLSYRILNGLELYAGTSVNVMISRLTDSDGGPSGSIFAPRFVFYKHDSRNTHLSISPGLNAGIRF